MKNKIKEVLEIVNELLKSEYTLKHYVDERFEVFYIPNGLNYHLKTHIDRDYIEKHDDIIDFLIDNIIKSIKDVKSEYVLDVNRWKF